MPRYRYLVMLAGALLLVGGLFSLLIALRLHVATWPRVRGVVGGLLALYLGWTLIRAAITMADRLFLTPNQGYQCIACF